MSLSLLKINSCISKCPSAAVVIGYLTLSLPQAIMIAFGNRVDPDETAEPSH